MSGPARGIPRYRGFAGPAVLSAGFRPFFLLGGAWAALAMMLWIGVLTGRLSLPSAHDPVLWHGHEMIFGYGLAVLGGYLLVAVPNWSGRMPLEGRPLALLVLLWITGRIAVWGSALWGAGAAALADLAFPAVLLVALGREVLTGRSWRNLPMLAALAALVTASAASHLAAAGLADGALASRSGAAVLTALIALMGGRLVPSFTRNWLARRRAPLPFLGQDRLDRLAVAATVAALAAWLTVPATPLVAVTALAAGLLGAFRLARWQGWRCWREPLLLALHAGYLWVVAGLLLAGAAAALPEVPEDAALHAFTAGAIGTMTLAVMLRTGLSHTGRSPEAGRWITLLLVLVTLAACLRVWAALAGVAFALPGVLAALAWVAAFGGFVLVMAPVLLRPRHRRAPVT